jgi:hypothetical protein
MKVKVSQYMDSQNPSHPYYDTLIKTIGDWNIVEHLVLRCSEKLEMIFLLVENDNNYMFCIASYLGVGLNEPGPYGLEKWKYENCIKDIKEKMIESRAQKKEQENVH